VISRSVRVRVLASRRADTAGPSRIKPFPPRRRLLPRWRKPSRAATNTRNGIWAMPSSGQFQRCASRASIHRQGTMLPPVRSRHDALWSQPSTRRREPHWLNSISRGNFLCMTFILRHFAIPLHEFATPTVAEIRLARTEWSHSASPRTYALPFARGLSRSTPELSLV